MAGESTTAFVYLRPAARTLTRALPSVALVALVLCYLIPLGARPLIAPDEFRYAEIGREMLASGDWVLPRLAGVLYFEKPVLGYWLTALSLGAFGHGAFAARLPFALSTLASAAVLFALLRRFGPGGRWGAAGAAAFLSSAGVLAIGTTTLLDPLFAFWTTATLAAFFVASERPAGRVRQAWLATSGVACGAAFLTKGLLAFAIPCCAAVPYLLWSGRSRDLLRLAWTPLGMALLTAAPWSLAIATRSGDFWPHFLIDEHWRRFAGGGEAQHPEAFWFFLPVLLVGALPWTPLAPLLCRAPASSSLTRFAICWLAGPLLLLSASSGKLVTYVLPCAAPLCIWMTCGAATLPPERLARALRRLAGGSGAICAALGLALLSPLATALDLDAVIGAGSPGPRLAGAVGLLLTSALATTAALAARPAARALGIGALLPVLFTIAAFWFPALPNHKAPERWLTDRVGPIPGDAIVVADRSFVYPVSWWLRRSDVRVFGNPGELGYGLQQPGQRDRLLYGAELDALLHDPERKQPVAVVARSDHFDPSVHPTPLRRQEQRGAVFAWYAAGEPTQPDQSDGSERRPDRGF